MGEFGASVDNDRPFAGAGPPPSAVLTKTLHIDFVSDVVCPCCVVGLGGLESALAVLKAEGIEADIHFQPFELNPGIAAEGETIAEHIARKYGLTPEQSAANRVMITDRAAEAWPGFEIGVGPDSRIWNTFDAHRLLHWAGTVGPGEQRALFRAHSSTARPCRMRRFWPTRPGLDRDKTVEVLADDLYAAEVREAEALWRSRGISAVPAVLVVEGKWLICGQPAGVFEDALRGMAREAFNRP